MRLQLLVIFWFALIAWSGQVNASAMDHCQTHAAKTVAIETTNNALTPTINIEESSSVKPALQFVTVLNSSAAALTSDTQIQVSNDHHTNLNSHDCCESDSDQHHCSGSCTSCDGCSTAHGAAMPTLWVMKTGLTQQKIQYSDYSYRHLQSSTQERPPKR